MADFSAQGFSVSMGFPFYCNDMIWNIPEGDVSEITFDQIKSDNPGLTGRFHKMDDGLWIRSDLCENIGGVWVDCDGVVVKSCEGHWSEWYKEFKLLHDAFENNASSEKLSVIMKQWFKENILNTPLNTSEIINEILQVTSSLMELNEETKLFKFREGI